MKIWIINMAAEIVDKSDSEADDEGEENDDVSRHQALLFTLLINLVIQDHYSSLSTPVHSPKKSSKPSPKSCKSLNTQVSLINH